MLETPSPPRRRLLLPLIILCLATVGGLVAVGAGAASTSSYEIVDFGPMSMGETLSASDPVVVHQVAPAEIHRGDIVVLDDSSWPDTHHVLVIKRVIAVGGDTVSCCDEQGRTKVNGKSISEDYLARHPALADNRGMTHVPYTTTVPTGHFFVAGDDRSNSRDSRVYAGPDMQPSIPADAIRAIVVAQRSGLLVRVLPATTVFTDAGLPGATPADDTYQRSVLILDAGVFLTALGAIGLVVLLVIRLRRRRAA